MKRNYSVKLNYNASITVDVEVEAEQDAPDMEGKALEMARNYAEEADFSEFTIGGERETQILAG
jgi:hypothetical protein